MVICIVNHIYHDIITVKFTAAYYAYCPTNFRHYAYNIYEVFNFTTQADCENLSTITFPQF